MLYGFLSDQGLDNWALAAEPVSSLDTGAGFFSDAMLNYYVNPATIRDIRPARLAMSDFSDQAKGDMAFNYDAAKLMYTPFNAITAGEAHSLFNILETIALSQNQSAPQINTVLTNATETYPGYVHGSLVMSAEVTVTDLRLITDAAETDIEVRNWFEFGMTIGQETITFHVWSNGAAFLTEYPYTSIIAVVPPCEPLKLVNNDFHSILSVLADSPEYINNIIDTKLGEADYSGLMTYKSRYVSNLSSTQYELSFGVLYKGPRPNGKTARGSIREYLLALNINTEGMWQVLLPDLFVQTQYYIVPIWDNTQVLPSITLYRSIVNVGRLSRLQHVIFASIATEHVDTYTDVLTCAGSDALMVSVPSDENDIIRSMLAEHPTYIAIDATQPRFDSQESKTKEFGIKLNQVMSVLGGAPNVNSFNENVILGRTWLSFTTNYTEYHVLKPTSFPSNVA